MSEKKGSIKSRRRRIKLHETCYKQRRSGDQNGKREAEGSVEKFIIIYLCLCFFVFWLWFVHFVSLGCIVSINELIVIYFWKVSTSCKFIQHKYSFTNFLKIFFRDLCLTLQKVKILLHNWLTCVCNTFQKYQCSVYTSSACLETINQRESYIISPRLTHIYMKACLGSFEVTCVKGSPTRTKHTIIRFLR